MSYGNVYVAQIAMGASNGQAVKAIVEAEKYDGPSIVIAYASCIAHGINMSTMLQSQKKAVAAGHWILYRYNPDLVGQGKNPLQLDSKEPSVPYEEYAFEEVRFRTLKAAMPERADELAKMATEFNKRRYWQYKRLAELDFSEFLK